MGASFIEKKAIASISQAIQTRIKPTNMIVKIAPHQRRVPAVRNMFSPERWASVLNACLKFFAINM